MMNLVRYNRPNSVFDLMDSFFNSYPNQVINEKKYAPLVDIYEKENAFFIEAQLPGMKKEDIKLEIKDGQLFLSGNSLKEKKEESENCYKREIIRGEFSRVFNMPDSADNEKLDAKFEDGILKIEIPKLEKIKPKQIEIN